MVREIIWQTITSEFYSHWVLHTSLNDFNLEGGQQVLENKNFSTMEKAMGKNIRCNLRIKEVVESHDCQSPGREDTTISISCWLVDEELWKERK